MVFNLTPTQHTTHEWGLRIFSVCRDVCGYIKITARNVSDLNQFILWVPGLGFQFPAWSVLEVQRSFYSLPVLEVCPIWTPIQEFLSCFLFSVIDGFWRIPDYEWCEDRGDQYTDIIVCRDEILWNSFYSLGWPLSCYVFLNAAWEELIESNSASIIEDQVPDIVKCRQY